MLTKHQLCVISAASPEDGLVITTRFVSASFSFDSTGPEHSTLGIFAQYYGVEYFRSKLYSGSCGNCITFPKPLRNTGGQVLMRP